jgi:hypothetical protein
MAGTGDELITKAQNKLSTAESAYQDARRAQATPGHEGRLKAAEKARDAAVRELSDTKSRWAPWRWGLPFGGSPRKTPSPPLASNLCRCFNPFHNRALWPELKL